MTLTPSQITAFQQGGAYYQAMVTAYGQPAADQIAAAAKTGDPVQVTNAIDQAKFGSPLDTSALSAMEKQLATDPLGAPLQSANSLISNTVSSLFQSPYVLGTLVLVGIGVLFYLFDGKDLVKKFVTK